MDLRLDPGAGETVLLVEDNEMVRRSIGAVLTSIGYRVLAAESGERAIDVLKKETGRIDLLLSDMVLPAMGGTDLMAEARTILPKLPILFMSGYDLSLAYRDSEAKFLQKPFDAHDLALAVRQALTQS
jgi:two-component system cell cycle sensor histidine kinase/response regulator CckA